MLVPLDSRWLRCIYVYIYIYICSVSLSVSLHVCVIFSLNHGSAIFQCHTQVILYTLLCNHADGSFSSSCVLTALSRYFGCLHTYTKDWVPAGPWRSPPGPGGQFYS